MRGQFVLQGSLELGIVLEAEPGDEAQDGGRTHACLRGKIGHRAQSDQGIVRHEGLGCPPLAGGHGVDAFGYAFGNACNHALSPDSPRSAVAAKTRLTKFALVYEIIQQRAIMLKT